MSFINRELALAYKGESFDVVMNMALINKIESAGVNVLKLAIDIDSGEMPPLSLLATMYSVILKSCGQNISPDDVWVELNQGDTAQLVANARIILMSMFPNVEEDKTKKDTQPS